MVFDYETSPPHRLVILNSCSPVVVLFGEFMEPLLDGAFVEEVCHCKLSKLKRTLHFDKPAILSGFRA